MDLYKHGEMLIAEIVDLPKGLTKLSPAEDIKIADSEVTGNYHMLQVIPGVHVWQANKADEYFVRADKPTKIYCKLENRHTDLELPSGKVFHITPAKEWNHMEQNKRNVLD